MALSAHKQVVSGHHARAAQVRSYVAAPVRNIKACAVGPLPAEGHPLNKMPYWDTIYTYLTQKGMRQLSPEDAQAMAESGQWVLLDVRFASKYENAHPEGAESAPLYQPLDTSNMDMAKVLKTIMYRFNGIDPVEMNPNFTATVKQIAASGKGVITMCEAGGTLIPTPNFPTGKSSRSLQAAFKLMLEGALPADKVAQLEGGVYGWYKADLPFDGEGEYDTSDIGKTPNAAPSPPEYVRANSK